MGMLFSLLDRLLSPVRRAGYYMGRLLPGLARLSRASLAAQAGLIALLFLLLTTTAVLFGQWYFHHGWEGLWSKLVVLVPLSFIIPALLYLGIRLLMTPVRSLYPDIDEAWRAGIDELAKASIPLRSVPLFLVLGGGRSGDRIQHVMSSAGLTWRAQSRTSAHAPLCWFASDEAIFLCVNGIGGIAELAELVQAGRGEQRFAGGGTLEGFPFGESAPPHDEFLVPSPSPVLPGRTIDLDQVLGNRGGQFSTESNSTAGEVGVSLAELRQQRSRLEYMCGLLRSARNPVCPMNGVMTLLPFHSILSAGQNAEVAIQQDLQVIASGLPVRCPGMLLITDMESEPGFFEFVRRVGPSASQKHRFGMSFNHLSPPLKEELAAFAQHVCGLYEDWTFQLFAQPGALQLPGNGQLFALMCKVRGRFRRILTSTLANGFGTDNVEEADNSLLFSGCYYAATGAPVGHRAFISAAIRKLLDSEEDLEWMPAAIEQNSRYRAGSNFVLLLGIALLAIALVIIWRVDTPPEGGDANTPAPGLVGS